MYRSFTQNNSLYTRLLNKSFSVNLSQSQYLSCHAKPDRTKWEHHMYIEQRPSYAHIAFPMQGTCYGFLQMSGARNQNSRKRLTCKNYIKLANPQINFQRLDTSKQANIYHCWVAGYTLRSRTVSFAGWDLLPQLSGDSQQTEAFGKVCLPLL